MMTGRYLSEINCFDNASEFSTEWPTIGHLLGAAGYESNIIGKMHFVGHDQWHGFGHRLALEADYTQGHDPDYYKLAYDWELPSGGNPIGKEWMGSSYVHKEVWDNYPRHFEMDEKIHHAALDYFARQPATAPPFFCCVSYHAPHNPFWIPDKYRERFRDQKLPLPFIPEGIATCHGPMDSWLNDFHYLPEIIVELMQEENLRWLYETFYGMIFDLDRRVGELLAQLERQGLVENTAVIFASDHGDMMAHRRMVQKRYFYERCTRVPLLFAFPGRWQQGIRVATPVSLIDLLPTFAELTHAPTPADLPGISLVPSLEHGIEPPERIVFSEYHGEGVHAPCFMAVDKALKYIYVPEYEERLYNREDDPDEFHNLIGRPGYASAAARLQNAILSQFDPAQIDRAARQSQRNRKLIYDCVSSPKK